MRDNILSIATSGGIRGEMPIDTDMHPPTAQRPLVVPLENSPLRLVVDRFTENLKPDDTLVASPETDAPAGIGLRFLNTGMGQDVPANLLLAPDASDFDFFGLAKVKMVAALDEAHPIAPAPKAAPETSRRDDLPFHETQMIFAAAAQPALVDTDRDARIGYHFQLEPVAGRPDEFDVTVDTPAGPRSWPLKEISTRWENFSGDGDPVQFRVAKYWPDFAVKNGQPVSLSSQPRNPVILVQITGPSRLLPTAPPAKAAAPMAMAKEGLALRIAPAREPGRLVYELERTGKIEARGTAVQSETIQLGWSKWVAKIESVLPHAEIHHEVKEFSGTPSPQMAAQMRPGIRAFLRPRNGADGAPVWIPAGTSREMVLGSDFAQVGFGQRMIPLPFQITLLNFEVPRDEGTDTPSNFISTLRFENLATGQTRLDKAFMNSPAMFPGEFWRSLLGWNYKFSQANWNPQNLNETTLQVLYDPGWPLKWIGSLGVCCGIALMFYFMPKRSPQERRDETPA
jgi:hypothetical protein